MRIALLLPGYSANERDWGIPAFRYLAEDLATRHHVRVFALYYPHRRDRYSVGPIPIQSFNHSGQRGAHTLALWTDAIRTIVQEGRRAQWDVLHAFFADQTGLCAIVAGRLLRAPVVLSLAGGEVVGLRDIHYGEQLWLHHRALIHWTTQRAASITAGSQYMLELARKSLPAAMHSNLRWAPLGVDTQHFQPNLRSIHEVRLLQVASRRPVKNPELLLRVFARITESCPDAQLEIIGRDWNDVHARGALVRGEISHDQLPAIYRRASVYAQTSRHEAQGIAVLEAAACGVPIVGTPVGILTELAPEAARVGETESELAGAVLDLLKNPGAAEQLGARARERVCENYSIDKSRERFERIYEEVARN